MVPGFSPSANARVTGLTVDGSDLYVSGGFSSIDGQARQKLARIDRVTGALDSGWRPSVSGGRVRTTALSPTPGQLVIGGAFSRVEGESRKFLASVSLVDGEVSPWAPRAVCTTCAMFDLVSDGTDVYAAIGGKGGGRAASFSPSQNAPRWVVHGDGNVQAIAVRQDTVFAGGHFGPDFAGVNRDQLAALDADDGSVLPYRVPFTGRNYPGVWDISADVDALRIGGGFTGIQGSTASRYAELGY